MHMLGSWGTEVEILAFADLSRLTIRVFCCAEVNKYDPKKIVHYYPDFSTGRDDHKG